MSAYYNEIDAKAAAWLRELIRCGHIAPGEVDERSIVEVRPDDLRGFTQCHFFAGIGGWSYALRRAGWADDRPVWTGSCPCQPFSAAGKGDEFADERHLWPAWFRLIRECRPVAVFGEQVASKDALAWLDHVSTDLEGEGYAIGAVDTCAAGFGAPHIRQRLYFVAESLAYSARQRERSMQDGRHSGSGVILVGPEPRCDSGDDGELGFVADPNGRNASAERQQRSGEQRLLAQGGGTDDVVAHSADSGYRSERDSESGRGEPVGDRLMGNPSRRGLGIERDAAQPGSSGHVDGAEQAKFVGDSEVNGRQGRPLRANGEPPHGTEETGQSGPTNGFWFDAEWLPCRDGKARPTEPGVKPLAYGVPARVVRLRGYGNAICIPVAEEFIRAYVEVRT